ncbi:hypothetical protein Q4E93_06200 [Flavitalea sp. BT771]|uniref:hypothetical protein n=1 Tax=Flavitalea sp. BT771 TaxID=3063329 RepID=UPI0026E3DC36|nr:hypothetical protein [Flavitalea sp. BT771]MDO6430167.1 hypothetical protein [Flavitalea sp. BT771]MDV6219694.1 hypothetical protein [Flavitalea sp. BT771]
MLLRVILYLVYTVYCLGFEWAAAIVGQRCKRAAWQDAYKWLVILCWVTVVVEMTDHCFILLRVQHHIFYNIWGYFETGGIIFIQRRLLKQQWTKHLLTAMLILLTIGTAANYVWGPPLNDLNPPFQLFTLFIQLIGTCAALIDILGDKTTAVPLSAQPAFWMNAGMLFYCSVFVLNYIFLLFFRSPGPIGWFFLVCSLIANTFMYGGFIACFLTLKKQPYGPTAGSVPDLHSVPSGN